MAVSALISLLIALVVLAVVVYVAMLIIDLIFTSQPWNRVAKLIMGLVAFLAFLKLLLPFLNITI